MPALTISCGFVSHVTENWGEILEHLETELTERLITLTITANIKYIIFCGFCCLQALLASYVLRLGH